jgi:hypothetical protein
MMISRIKSVFNIGNFLFVILLFLLAMFSLHVSSWKWEGHKMTAMAYQARDIYVSMTGVNTERKASGLPLIWPRTACLTDGTEALSSKTFKTSTEYFQALYDEAHTVTTNRGLNIRGFDFSKCAGAGVKACTNSTLTADHNAWLIAANVTEEDDDRIPLLISRNVDVRLIEEAVNQGITTSDFRKRLSVGQGKYKKPFGQIGFVFIRKGGGMLSVRSRYATLGAIAGWEPEPLPPRDPSKPRIVYLEP